MDDPLGWKEIASGAALVAFTIGGWVVNRHMKESDGRFEALEEKAADLAPARAFEQHKQEDRETFVKLFEGQQEIKDDIQKGFLDVQKTISGIHVSVLQELGRKVDK